MFQPIQIDHPLCRQRVESLSTRSSWVGCGLSPNPIRLDPWTGLIGGVKTPSCYFSNQPTKNKQHLDMGIDIFLPTMNSWFSNLELIVALDGNNKLSFYSKYLSFSLSLQSLTPKPLLSSSLLDSLFASFSLLSFSFSLLPFLFSSNRHWVCVVVGLCSGGRVVQWVCATRVGVVDGRGW